MCQGMKLHFESPTARRKEAKFWASELAGIKDRQTGIVPIMMKTCVVHNALVQHKCQSNDKTHQFIAHRP